MNISGSLPPEGILACGKRFAAHHVPCAHSSLATYVPPKVLTNADLEKMVETSDEWILQRTGIRERHIVEPGVATSDLATEAAKKAIERAGLTPDDIDFIVVGTTTPDMLFPSTACLVQHKIGASRRLGLRPVRRVFGIHLCADDGSANGVHRREQTRAGDRRGRHVEHHRLHRSHHVRHLW
jgi:predicted naringenin-chalcone synthase